MSPGTCEERESEGEEGKGEEVEVSFSFELDESELYQRPIGGFSQPERERKHSQARET